MPAIRGSVPSLKEVLFLFNVNSTFVSGLISMMNRNNVAVYSLCFWDDKRTKTKLIHTEFYMLILYSSSNASECLHCGEISFGPLGVCFSIINILSFRCIVALRSKYRN